MRKIGRRSAVWYGVVVYCLSLGIMAGCGQSQSAFQVVVGGNDAVRLSEAWTRVAKATGVSQYGAELGRLHARFVDGEALASLEFYAATSDDMFLEAGWVNHSLDATRPVSVRLSVSVAKGPESGLGQSVALGGAFAAFDAVGPYHFGTLMRSGRGVDTYDVTYLDTSARGVISLEGDVEWWNGKELVPLDAGDSRRAVTPQSVVLAVYPSRPAGVSQSSGTADSATAVAQGSQLPVFVVVSRDYLADVFAQ